jgi:hypothetical protein
MARKTKDDDEMRSHYDFSGGARGKYAARYAKGKTIVGHRCNELRVPDQAHPDRVHDDRAYEISLPSTVLQVQDLSEKAMDKDGGQNLIESAGFTYWAGRELYIHTKAKKIISLEEVDDLSEERLRKFIAAPNDSGEWMFSTPPTDLVRKTLLAELE